MEGSQGNFKDSCLTVGKYIEESKVQKGLKMFNIFFFFFFFLKARQVRRIPSK